MTFREKLREEHPSKVNVFTVGGCAGCPYWYGYEENQVFTLCKGANSTNKECEACWNRQMPEDNNIKEKEVKKSMTKTKVEQHLELVTALNKLYEQKNHDYGDSFGKSYAEDGLVMAKIRISDKFNRFKTLIKSDAKVNDESIRDTLIDLANYALMTVMELDNEKENK